jgi:hypothetical protein
MLNTVTASVPFKFSVAENSRLFKIPEIDWWELSKVSGFEGDFLCLCFQLSE